MSLPPGEAKGEKKLAMWSGQWCRAEHRGHAHRAGDPSWPVDARERTRAEETAYREVVETN